MKTLVLAIIASLMLISCGGDKATEAETTVNNEVQQVETTATETAEEVKEEVTETVEEAKEEMTAAASQHFLSRSFRKSHRPFQTSP